MTRFKVIVNDLECNFYFDSAASTDIAKEAVFQCLKWLGDIEDAAKKAASASEQKPEEVPSPDVSSVEVSDV
jgi:hypothetical protein